MIGNCMSRIGVIGKTLPAVRPGHYTGRRGIGRQHGNPPSNATSPVAPPFLSSEGVLEDYLEAAPVCTLSARGCPGSGAGVSLCPHCPELAMHGAARSLRRSPD